MEQKSHHELRREERKAVRLNAFYNKVGQSGFKSSIVENISAHGVFLKVKEELTVGDDLEVMISKGKQEDNPLMVVVKVIFKSKFGGYGCKVISDETFDVKDF
jgi:hypothetical protein